MLSPAQIASPTLSPNSNQTPSSVPTALSETASTQKVGSLFTSSMSCSSASSSTVGTTSQSSCVFSATLLDLFSCAVTREQAVREEVEQRWRQLFQHKTSFPLWKRDPQEHQLREGWDRFDKARWELYFVSPEEARSGKDLRRHNGYQAAQAVFPGYRTQFPFPIAFAYNVASPVYNASLVFVDDLFFLASESPTQDNVQDFLSLFQKYQCTDLVRLTAAHEGDKKRCHPYWEGCVDSHDPARLHLDGYQLRYFSTDQWNKWGTIEPSDLIQLVKSVASVAASTPKKIAVHCHAGEGRTGTFIAAYILIHQIDRQIAEGVLPDNISVSIDKVLWQLALQRPFLVMHWEQYKSLHQMVEIYLDGLRQESL